MIRRSAQELFEAEWQRVTGGRRIEGSRSPAPEECPAMRVMPILLELLAECHDRPAHYFTPTIRRQLIEHCFIIDNGDDMDKQERVVSLEQQVQMLVRVLEQLRQTLLRQGQWSDAPVTPQMFG